MAKSRLLLYNVNPCHHDNLPKLYYRTKFRDINPSRGSAACENLQTTITPRGGGSALQNPVTLHLKADIHYSIYIIQQQIQTTMIMNLEDQTAPIKREEIGLIIAKSYGPDKVQLVAKLMGYLHEKRDSYNGVISSLIYMIDSQDEELLSLLGSSLQSYIASKPMRYGGKIFVTRCLTRLVAERPEFTATFFARFMSEKFCRWQDNVNSCTERLRIKIVALKAIAQVEQKTGKKMTDIPSELIDTICDDAILQGDETTKIDTLYILLDTKQATKVLIDRELDIFRIVFKESLNFQVPSLRQKFLAIANKLFKRIRDSTRVVAREKTRFSDNDREIIIQKYMSFLNWIVVFCLDNIYCNKYFGSFIITMTTLGYIIEHITLNHPNLPIGSALTDRRFHDSILSCLALDSFEDNKFMALKLLFALPQYKQTNYESNLKLFEKISYELVNSVNPAHTLTCQYIYKLLIGFRQIQTEIKKNVLIYEHLDKLVSLVEAGVQEIKDDFIQALKNNAIYPKLTCIRALLDEIDRSELDEHRDLWEKLASRLVKVSIASCEAVSSIVCNMNPETIGHLPMDLKPVDAQMLSVNSTEPSTPILENNQTTITSQHLLITGWKTIKECSLSMGAMCTIFWWPESEKTQAQSQPILREDHVRDIIDFFEHYLRNLRHRGAFEQAYNGFVMVSKRIWLDKQYKNILLNNLNSIMNDFKSGQDDLDDQKVDYLKKHVTRRSAGLPFLVQAIVVSEDKNESETFRSIMSSLISVSTCPTAETYQKIHCLNILKALVNDFNLGHKVTPYIGQILLITIEAFSSDDFPIRNCANMLMRVLVDRAFGVSRLRDEIHKRNTMSYEKFFTDYPEVHKRFECYLRDGLSNRKSFASVHAVFIVLFRLRPSLNPSENFTVAKAVEPYIDLVHKLALTCPDYRLRELAAKLFVQLEIHRNIELNYSNFTLFEGYQNDFINKEIIENFRYHLDRNMLHGMICILKSWLEHQAEIPSELLREQLFKLVDEFVREVIFNQKQLGLTSHAVPVYSAAIDLIERYSLILMKVPIVYQPKQFCLYRSVILTKEIREGKVQVPSTYGPMLESLIFKGFCLEIALSCQFDPLTDKNLHRIVQQIREKPNRIVGLNLQAALIRLLRQYLSRSNDFVDKLMANLDLDLTAAHMTPADKLDQCSELDAEKELWLKYCENYAVKNMVIREMSVTDLDILFDFSQYDEFKQISSENYDKLNIRSINTPRSIELLAYALKGWIVYELDERCVWSHLDETIIDKLRLLVNFLHHLPDCDIKCPLLLCTSIYFKTKLKQIHALYGIQKENENTEFVVNQSKVMKDFSLILDELAESHHNKMTRETCCEILKENLKTAIECWCRPLKETQMNLLSTLIKLCQDEEHEIRQASTRVLSTLNSLYPVNDDELNLIEPTTESRLGHLVSLISTKLLDPKNQQDVLSFFQLLVRIIFNHPRGSLFDVNEERESLFDKTKPNIFADHVATIHNALRVASAFFKRVDKERIDLDTIELSADVLQELSARDIQNQIDNKIGDYSWRLKGGSSPRSTKTTDNKSNNRCRIDEALTIVKRNLSYFNHWNMLTDTSFGYHESSIFKRLAFVKLLIECTNYENNQLICGVQSELKKTISVSCATTILCKCHELFNPR